MKPLTNKLVIKLAGKGETNVHAKKTKHRFHWTILADRGGGHLGKKCKHFCSRHDELYASRILMLISLQNSSNDFQRAGTKS